MSTFSDLGLSTTLVEALSHVHITTPHPIQTSAIPPILENRSVLGLAETGSGKTAAFMLPLLHQWNANPFGVFAVVLAPTRELAVQLEQQVQVLGALAGATSLAIIGGVDETAQATALLRRPAFVVATPGRLAALLAEPSMRKVLSLARHLVLDEADRLLPADEMGAGFAAALAEIRAAMPRATTHFFSATRNSRLMEEAGKVNATVIDCVEGGELARVPENLTQNYVFLPEIMRPIYLAHLLQHTLPAATYPSVMVFTKSAASAMEMAIFLAELGETAVALCGALGQRQRMAALAGFRAGKYRILVATDVASRGLDIGQGVSLVINYDMPVDAADYVHRVGRSGRAGREGKAVSLVSEHDLVLLDAAEKLVGKKLTALEVSENTVAKAEDRTRRALARAAVKMQEDNNTTALDKHRAKNARKGASA